jgi:tRNA-specific 2-thiouridylase
MKNSAAHSKTPAKVLVALSGGLMSAVVAAILKRQGYQVHGVHFQLGGTSRKEQAERVAAKLGISLVQVGLEDEWEYWIRDHIIHQLLANRLPEPEMVATQNLLIEHLLATAKELGCPWVATGHFARVAIDPSSQSPRLLRAHEQDQSHLLSRLTAEGLGHFILPMGDLPLAAIEKLGAELGLETTQLGTSRPGGLCGVSPGEFTRLAEAFIPPSLAIPGQIKTEEGMVVGEHHGLFRYSIGKKAEIPEVKSNKELEGWVPIRVEPITQSLYIGPESALQAQTSTAEDVSWIQPVNGLKPLECLARLVTSPMAEPAFSPCLVNLYESNLIQIEFKDPQRALVQGQTVVFYREDEVLGSAFILCPTRMS